MQEKMRCAKLMLFIAVSFDSFDLKKKLGRESRHCLKILKLINKTAN